MMAGSDDTRTEREKMMAGDLYYSFAPKAADLEQDRANCRIKVAAYNASRGLTEEEQKLRLDMLVDLFGSVDTSERAFIEPPFSCDYGYNIHLGRDVYVNFGAVFLDCNTIHIGDRCLLAPNVQLYTAGHPLDPVQRNGTSGPEFARPIRIGNDCWVGGSVIILPGVTVGEGCTIGAGSVVTKDVEPYTVVAGNPARVIKRLPRQHQEEQ